MPQYQTLARVVVLRRPKMTALKVVK